MASILVKLNGIYESLTPTERRVADCILADPERIPFQSIYDIAKAADASVPTVSRLTQKLDCANYAEFKIQIAREATSPVSAIFQGIDAHDSDEAIVQKVFGGNMRSL